MCEKLLYIVFCFLIIPFKKKYLEKINSLFKDKNIDEKIIDKFHLLCLENKENINDFFIQKIEYIEIHNSKLILNLFQRLNSDNDIYFYDSINKNLNVVVSVVNSYQRHAFIEILILNLEKSKYLLKNNNFQENKIVKKVMIDIINNIHLSLSMQTIIFNIEINQKEFSENKKDIEFLGTKLEEISKQTENIKDGIKKNAPLVAQLSIFGTFFAILFGPIGILYTASAGFFMLKENISFYKPYLLLLLVVVCILAFIYVAQRIFFAGSDKKHIPFFKIFIKPILWIFGLSIIITLIYHLLDSYTFYEILHFFNFH